MPRLRLTDATLCVSANRWGIPFYLFAPSMGAEQASGLTLRCTKAGLGANWNNRMKRFQQILRRNKFIFWLVQVGAIFAVLVGIEALLGRPDWFWVIGMSLIVPTVLYLLFALDSSDRP